MSKVTNKRTPRQSSLSSNTYTLEKEHDYDSDATLDIDDVTPSGRPFGAPLRRMSDYGSPYGVPMQLVGSVVNGCSKKAGAIEVLTLPVCEYYPSEASSSSATRPKRERTMSSGGTLRKLVDKVVNKSTASPSLVYNRPFIPSPLSKGTDVNATVIMSPSGPPSSYMPESSKMRFPSLSPKKKTTFTQVQ